MQNENTFLKASATRTPQQRCHQSAKLGTRGFGARSWDPCGTFRSEWCGCRRN